MRLSSLAIRKARNCSLSLLEQILLDTDSQHEGTRCSAAHRVASEYPREDVRVHFCHGFTCPSRTTSPDRCCANNKRERPPTSILRAGSHHQQQYSDRHIRVGDSRSQLPSGSPWRFSVHLPHRCSVGLVSGRRLYSDLGQVDKMLWIRQIKRSAGNRNNSLLRFEQHVRQFVQMVRGRRPDHAHTLEGAARGRWSGAPLRHASPHTTALYRMWGLVLFLLEQKVVAALLSGQMTRSLA